MKNFLIAFFTDLKENWKVELCFFLVLFVATNIFITADICLFVGGWLLGGMICFYLKKKI